VGHRRQHQHQPAYALHWQRPYLRVLRRGGLCLPPPMAIAHMLLVHRCRGATCCATRCDAQVVSICETQFKGEDILFIVPDSDVASVLQVRCVNTRVNPSFMGTRDVGRPPRAAVTPLSASLASSQPHARPALEGPGRLVAPASRTSCSCQQWMQHLCRWQRVCRWACVPCPFGRDPPLVRPPPCSTPAVRRAGCRAGRRPAAALQVCPPARGSARARPGAKCL